MANMSGFPFMSDQEFAQACHELQDSCDCSVLTDEFNVLTLRFTRPFLPNYTIRPGGKQLCEVEEECSNGVDEVDEETLVKSSGIPSAVLLYDIILHPSYRVPVVYLQLETSGVLSPVPDFKVLHDMIVPGSHRGAIELSGVYGGLSMTGHPINGLPSYFVHPCRTADALRACSESGKVSPMEYMMLWFGIIGTSVDLALPIPATLR